MHVFHCCAHHLLWVTFLSCACQKYLSFFCLIFFKLDQKNNKNTFSVFMDRKFTYHIYHFCLKPTFVCFATLLFKVRTNRQAKCDYRRPGGHQGHIWRTEEATGLCIRGIARHMLWVKEIFCVWPPCWFPHKGKHKVHHPGCSEFRPMIRNL